MNHIQIFLDLLTKPESMIKDYNKLINIMDIFKQNIMKLYNKFDIKHRNSINFYMINILSNKFPKLDIRSNEFVKMLINPSKYYHDKKILYNNSLYLFHAYSELLKIYDILYSPKLDLKPPKPLELKSDNIVREKPPVSIIIKEKSDTNFGHEKLILLTNIVFPDRDEDRLDTLNTIIERLGDGSSYDLDKDCAHGNIFHKQHYISEALNDDSRGLRIDICPNDKQYFELYRYSISTFNFQPPRSNDKPTLSMSLFIPNDKKEELNINHEWYKKYFINQITHCALFTYYQYHSNYRIYFDKYLLDYLESIEDDKKLFNLSLINELNYNDYESNDDVKNAHTHLKNFMLYLKNIENEQYNNALERFLSVYDIACRFYNNNITDRTGDFFVYKFKGPFIENYGTHREGHITNGYLGQVIRFISMRQVNYQYVDKTIQRPKHLIFRDSHTNCIGYNDNEWIKSFHQLVNETTEIYLLPLNELGYTKCWHNLVKHKYLDKIESKSVIAGHIQMINSNNTNYWINNEIYFQSIGLAFMINGNKLILKNHRPYQLYGKNILKDYEYGIEEYIFDFFFNMPHFLSKSIYLNYRFSQQANLYDNRHIILNSDGTIDEELIRQNLGTVLGKTTALLFNYVYDKLSEYFTLFNLINEIENIRNIKKSNLYDHMAANNEEFNILNLLISIYPSKYQIVNTIFNNKDNKLLFTSLMNKLYFKEKIMSILDLHNLDLTYYNLNTLNINCSHTVFNSPIESFQNSYLYGKDILQCHSGDYYSGFYDVRPPNVNIGILRTPNDIKNVFETIQGNKYSAKLEISAYAKGKIDNWAKNVDVTNNGKIKYNLEYLILSFNSKTIARTENSLDLFSPVDKKLIMCMLIWKALLYKGYNIPGEWVQNNSYTYTITSDIYRKFNNIAKELASIDEWDKFAIFVLDTDPELDIRPESIKEIVKDIIGSKKFINYEIPNELKVPILEGGTNINIFTDIFNKINIIYESSILYDKYLKYKQKYFKLKH